jgi:hypothetical protein
VAGCSSPWWPAHRYAGGSLIPPRTMSASVVSRSDRQARGSPSKDVTRTAEGAAAAAGHSATNVAWPNCGASVGYPARNHPTILFSIPVRVVVRFIWLLLPRGVHLRTDLEKAPDIRCTLEITDPQ